jgi:hypothetical protein
VQLFGGHPQGHLKVSVISTPIERLGVPRKYEDRDYGNNYQPAEEFILAAAMITTLCIWI